MNQFVASVGTLGIAAGGGRNLSRFTSQSKFPSHTVANSWISTFEAMARGEGRQLRPDTEGRRRSKASEHKHSGIQMCRWKDEEPKVRQYSLSAACDCIAVNIALSYTELTLWVGEQCVHQGGAKPGTALVTSASPPTRAEFRGPHDVLHLFVPTRLFLYISNMAGVATAQPDPILPIVEDSEIERLARSLIWVDDLQAFAAEIYVDAITTALLARLLGPNSRCSTVEYVAKGGLAAWRLKRVLNFVEAHLAEPLSLEKLAACAGLSRMYFAAQFRAVTGVKPHEYLTRRRVERASKLLRETKLPLVEIALDVGFQTQAHFTTVFRRLTGETPNRWRQKHREADRQENNGGTETELEPTVSSTWR